MALGLPRGTGQGYQPLAEINVTPMVDVMLVLLIVFMVAAPLMMTGVPVELPRTSAARLAQPKQPLIVSIDRDGRLFVQSEPVSAAELVPRLQAAAAGDAGRTVYVRGDRAIAYGEVMRLMGAVGQAGLAKLSLIGEAEPIAVQAR